MNDTLPGRERAAPMDARERLVDRIGSDFYGLQQQLTTGLQAAARGPQGFARSCAAVRAYIGDVLKGLHRMEAGVVRLADVPGAPEAGYGAAETPDPAPGMDPKGHGHLTLSGLFQEIREDEAAAKREDAHWYGTAREKDQGIER